MAKAKRFLSIVLAALMVFGTMSCLASVVASAATYEHDAWSNWDISFADSTWDGIDSMDELRAKYNTWSASNAWVYMGIEVYENVDGEWVLTDHYVEPGQELLLKYYIKGDCYMGGGATLYTLFERNLFDINAYSDTAAPTYTEANDLAGDGYANGGFTSLDTTWCTANPNSTVGSTAANLKTSAKPAGLVTQFKGSTATTANAGTGLVQNDTKYFDAVWTQVNYPTVSGQTVLTIAEDEYVYSCRVQVRENLAEGTVGHLGVEENSTRWHNGTRCPMYVYTSAVGTTLSGKATATTAGTKNLFHSEDCNHTFIIGEPGDAPAGATATFVSQGTTVATLTGSSVTAPAAPTAPAGQTFGGWTDGTNTYQAGDTIAISADTTFTAVWTSAGYTAKFYDGTSEYTSLKETNATSITLPAAQTKNGYRFNGWNDGSRVYAAGAAYTLTANTDFTADWTKLYTATFTGDGVTTTTAQYAAGETINFPSVTPRENYTYSWSPADSVMPAADTTYTIVWSGNNITITYDVAGGSAVPAASGAYNSQITLGSTAKTGYTFKGWSDGTTTYAAGATYTLTASKTLTAVWEANPHTVTYMNGTTQERQDNVSFGDALPTAPSIAPEGYNFNGWVDADGKAPSDYTTMPDKDLVFTASLTAKQYTVNFYTITNGYIAEGSGKQTYGQTIVAPAGPTVEGQEFSGWTYTKAGTTEAYTGTTVPAFNLDAHPTYGAASYNLTFILDGVQLSSEDVPYNSPIVYPAVENLPAGKQFDGWDYTGETMPANTLVITGTTSYINYTVKYYKQAGDAEAYATYENLHYGDTMPAPEDPSVPGMSFEGWDNDAATVSGNANIYGIFNNLSYEVEVTYGLNGEKEDGFEVTYGETITEDMLPDDAAVAGYGLTWQYDGAAIRFPFAVPALDAGATIAITAVYGAETKTLTYYVVTDGVARQNGAQETYATGAAITIKDVPTEDGYNIDGWYTNADCTGDKFTETTMPANNVALYAKKSAERYTDTWLDMDGSVYTTTQEYYGATITAPELPVHPGYDLVWSPTPTTQEAGPMTFQAKGAAQLVNYSVKIYNENLDGTYELVVDTTRQKEVGETATATSGDKTATGYTVNNEKSTLSATVLGDGSTVITVYRDLNRYTVTVDGVEATYKYGQTLETPADAEKTGYTFTGWTWSKTAGGASIAKPATVTSNLFATANFTKNQYDLTVVVDGKTVDTIKVYYGDAIATVAPYSETGKQFHGWYADSAYATEYTFGEAMTETGATIYGYFEDIEYTYTFVSEGKSEPVKGYYGDPVTAPEAAAKTGYTFTVWSPAVPATFGTESKTFVAQYKVNNYDLKFYVDGTLKTTLKVPYGTAKADIANVPTAAKTGYKFEGWDTIPDTMPAEEVSVNATWTANTYNAVFYAVEGDTEAVETKPVVFGESFNAPAAPAERPYYTFAGWKVAGTSTVYAAGAAITMDAEGMTFVGAWNQDTSACRVQSVVRTTANYYQKSGADYDVTLAEGVKALTLTIEYTNEYGTKIVSTYSKPSYYLGGSAINSISTVNGCEVWNINATLAQAENAYKAYITLEDGTAESADNAFIFSVTYDAKPDSQIADEFKTAAISNTSIIRGDKATWTVTTSTNVTWLEFVGTYTTEAGEEKTLTTYYKYSNYTSATEGTMVKDADGVRTWTIPMTFSYAVADGKVVETWNILYKLNGSSVWETGKIDGAVYAPVITIGRTAKDLDPATTGYDKYELVSVSADKTSAAVGEAVTFTIVTTDDVSKVRIGFAYTASGVAKTKTYTYQPTSANVTQSTANGLTTWTIVYKVPAAAAGSTTDFNVQARGDAWGTAQSQTIVVA